MVLKGDLRLFHLTFNFLKFKQTVRTMIRRHSVPSDLNIHCQFPKCPSPGFTDNLLSIAIYRHSGKKKKKKKKKKKEKKKK